MAYKENKFIADYYKREFIQNLKDNQKELSISQYKYLNKKQLISDIFSREMTVEESDLYDEIFGFIYKMLYDNVITLDGSLMDIIHFTAGYIMSSSSYINHRDGKINLLEELSTKGCMTKGQSKHNLDETISRVNLDKFREWNESTGMFSVINTIFGATPTGTKNLLPINVFGSISEVQVVESYNHTKVGEPFKSYHLNCTLDFDLKNSDTVTMDIIGRALEYFIYIKRRELRYLNNSRALYLVRQSRIVPESKQLKAKIMDIDSCVMDNPILDGIATINEVRKPSEDDF